MPWNYWSDCDASANCIGFLSCRIALPAHVQLGFLLTGTTAKAGLPNPSLREMPSSQSTDQCCDALQPEETVAVSLPRLLEHQPSHPAFDRNRAWDESQPALWRRQQPEVQELVWDCSILGVTSSKDTSFKTCWETSPGREEVSSRELAWDPCIAASDPEHTL